MNKKFYITTPIYYVNDVPHIGHAYTTIAADVLARYWRRKLGDENVFFLTGTDEHGAKIAQAAREAGKEPKEFVDSVAPQFEESWKLLNLSYDHFIRTTDPRHEKLVQEVLQKVYDNGYIEEGVYEGLYCEGCEKFLTEEDLVEGKCPLHPNKEPQYQKEKNYFFKLSLFKERLIDLFEKDEIKILPESRKNEVLGKLRGGLQDVSISREGVSWGITVPWDNTQTVYVWFDALLNYYTATQFFEGKEKFWPADLHLLGKDILWFHSIVWGAMLLAAEIPTHKSIFAHGFFSINGQKMSKSLGNVISPKELTDKYGVDGTRYLLLSAFPFGHDGDFSFEKLDARFNSDLANGFGNLVSRIATLCEKNEIEASEYEEDFDPQFEKHLTEYRFGDAIDHLSGEITAANKKINDEKPWGLEGKKAREVLIDLVRKIQYIAFNLQPFTPETSEKILKQFTGKIKTADPLFPRI